MNEEYKNASIIFLRELYEREDMESQKLRRKKDISCSSEYNEDISCHEWHKKLIEYLMICICSFNTEVCLSPGHENGTEGRIEDF